MDDAAKVLEGTTANENAVNAVHQQVANQNADLITAEYGADGNHPNDDMPPQVHSFGV